MVAASSVNASAILPAASNSSKDICSSDIELPSMSALRPPASTCGDWLETTLTISSDTRLTYADRIDTHWSNSSFDKSNPSEIEHGDSWAGKNPLGFHNPDSHRNLIHSRMQQSFHKPRKEL